MTSLQVDYWNYEEKKRTNLANENLRGQELKETTRHNKAMEGITAAQVGEQQRHNLAMEEQGVFANETQRYDRENWVRIQDSQLALSKSAQDLESERIAVQERSIALDEARFEWQKVTDVASMVTRAVQTVSNVGDTWFDNRYDLKNSLYGWVSLLS